MVIAALLSFFALLVAWMAAPDRGERTAVTPELSYRMSPRGRHGRTGSPAAS